MDNLWVMPWEKSHFWWGFCLLPQLLLRKVLQFGFADNSTREAFAGITYWKIGQKLKEPRTLSLSIRLPNGLPHRSEILNWGSTFAQGGLPIPLRTWFITLPFFWDDGSELIAQEECGSRGLFRLLSLRRQRLSSLKSRQCFPKNSICRGLPVVFLLLD